MRQITSERDEGLNVKGRIMQFNRHFSGPRSEEDEVKVLKRKLVLFPYIIHILSYIFGSILAWNYTYVLK